MATNVEIVNSRGLDHDAEKRNPCQGRSCYGFLEKVLRCGYSEKLTNDGEYGGEIVFGSIALDMGGRIFQPANHAALIKILREEDDGDDADFVPLVEMLRDDPTLWLCTC